MFERNPESFGAFGSTENEGANPENTQETEKTLSLFERTKRHWDSMVNKLKPPHTTRAKAFLMSSLALLAVSTERVAEADGYIPLHENTVAAQGLTLEQVRAGIQDERFLEIFDRETNTVETWASEESDDGELLERRETNIAIDDGVIFDESKEGSLPETLESVRLEAATYLTDVTSNEHDFSGFANVVRIEQAELPENYESVTLQLVGYSFTSREDAVLDALRTGSERLGVRVDTSARLEEQGEDATHSMFIENNAASRTEAYIVRAEVEESPENEGPREEGEQYLVRITVEFATVEQPNSSQ